MTDTLTPTTTATEVVLSKDAYAQLANLALFAGTDPCRLVLTHVRIEVTAEGVRGVATDSYALCIEEGIGSAVGPEGSFLVSAKWLAEVGKRVAKCKGSTVSMTFAGATVTATDRDGSTSSQLLDADYPAYTGLIPTSDAIATDRIAYATKELARLGKVTVAGHKPKEVLAVRSSFFGEHKPSTHRIGATCFVLQMPTKVW